MVEFYNDIITNDSAPIMEIAERYLGLDDPVPEQEHTDNDIYESAVDNISQVISDYEEPEASTTDDISGTDLCIQDMLDDYLDDVYDDFTDDFPCDTANDTVYDTDIDNSLIFDTADVLSFID